MPETSIVKKSTQMEKNSQEDQLEGREDVVRNDLKKMKLMKWAEQVQDRPKWKDIVEKAKILSELWRHRRRRCLSNIDSYNQAAYVT